MVWDLLKASGSEWVSNTGEGSWEGRRSFQKGRGLVWGLLQRRAPVSGNGRDAASANYVGLASSDKRMFSGFVCLGSISFHSG